MLNEVKNKTGGQSFKPPTIVIYDSRVIPDLKLPPYYDPRVTIYDRRAFIRLATVIMLIYKETICHVTLQMGSNPGSDYLWIFRMFKQVPKVTLKRVGLASNNPFSWCKSSVNMTDWLALKGKFHFQNMSKYFLKSHFRSV